MPVPPPYGADWHPWEFVGEKTYKREENRLKEYSNDAADRVLSSPCPERDDCQLVRQPAASPPYPPPTGIWAEDGGKEPVMAHGPFRRELKGGQEWVKGIDFGRIWDGPQYNHLPLGIVEAVYEMALGARVHHEVYASIRLYGLCDYCCDGRLVTKEILLGESKGVERQWTETDIVEVRYWTKKK